MLSGRRGFGHQQAWLLAVVRCSRLGFSNALLPCSGAATAGCTNPMRLQAMHGLG